MKNYYSGDYEIIGTCSICGGPVGVPKYWWGVSNPTPKCLNCGAVAQQNHGPVIPMKPRPLPNPCEPYEPYEPYPPRKPWDMKPIKPRIDEDGFWKQKDYPPHDLTIRFMC